MNKNKIIRQFTALGFLLLFAFSNTPKQWLHSLFADHVDGKMGKAATRDNYNIKQLSFHCACDHLVVESPFTYLVPSNSFYAASNYLRFISSSYAFIAADHTFQFDLRGPPVV